MKLKHLRSFVLTAETASFSVAASRCYLTQSAVSQHIKVLDDELQYSSSFFDFTIKSLPLYETHFLLFSCSELNSHIIIIDVTGCH